MVQTGPLISHTYDITAWQQAFDSFEQKQGIKSLLLPVG